MNALSRSSYMAQGKEMCSIARGVLCSGVICPEYLQWLATPLLMGSQKGFHSDLNIKFFTVICQQDSTRHFPLAISDV